MPHRRGAVNIGRRAVRLALAYVILTGGLLSTLLLRQRAEDISASKRELSAFAQLTAGHTFEVALGTAPPRRQPGWKANSRPSRQGRSFAIRALWTWSRPV